jgi:hypothetical protein
MYINLRGRPLWVGWGCKPAKKPYFASAGDFVAPNPHQVSRVHEALRPKKGADHRLVSTMSEKG